MADESWRLCESCKSYNSPQARECVACSGVLKHSGSSVDIPQKSPSVEAKPFSAPAAKRMNPSRKTCGNCGNSNPETSYNCLVCKHALNQVVMGLGSQSQEKIEASKGVVYSSAAGAFHSLDSDLSSRDGSILRGRQFGERLAAESGNPWSDLSHKNKGAVETRIRAQLLADIRVLTDGIKRHSIRRAWRITAWFSIAILFANGFFLAIASPDQETLLGSLTISLLFTLSTHLFLRVGLVDRKMRKPLSDVEAGVTAGCARYSQALDEVKYSRPSQGAREVPVATVTTLTPREAENFCAAWLVRLGHLDAQVTRFSRDGGIDVEAKNVIAQVKHQQSNVGVKPIRELHGVAVVSSKKAVFFTLTGYSSDALDFAHKISMPLFVYRNSELHPCNVHAQLFAAGR